MSIKKLKDRRDFMIRVATKILSKKSVHDMLMSDPYIEAKNVRILSVHQDNFRSVHSVQSVHSSHPADRVLQIFCKLILSSTISIIIRSFSLVFIQNLVEIFIFRKKKAYKYQRLRPYRGDHFIFISFMEDGLGLTPCETT